MARKEISPGSRTLYALNMPAPRVRATMFTRQGRRTDPHGHSHSVELHEAASPYRHPRYDRPSAKERLIPLVPSAASGRLQPVLAWICRSAEDEWQIGVGERCP